MSRTEPGSSSVFIVDDDEAVRDSLALLLRLGGLQAQAYASAEAFLAQYARHTPGCLLLDVRMPGMSGLDLQRELAARDIALPVIVMTAHGDVATARAALKAGAFDFFEKPVDDTILIDVVRNALDHDARERESTARTDATRQRMARLTPREREVMQQLAEGKHNRDIAQALGISPRTVEVYKARMMEKLQARSLADVIKLALAARD